MKSEPSTYSTEIIKAKVTSVDANAIAPGAWLCKAALGATASLEPDLTNARYICAAVTGIAKAWSGQQHTATAKAMNLMLAIKMSTETKTELALVRVLLCWHRCISICRLAVYEHQHLSVSQFSAQKVEQSASLGHERKVKRRSRGRTRKQAARWCGKAT